MDFPASVTVPTLELMESITVHYPCFIDDGTHGGHPLARLVGRRDFGYENGENPIGHCDVPIAVALGIDVEYSEIIYRHRHAPRAHFVRRGGISASNYRPQSSRPRTSWCGCRPLILWPQGGA